MNKPFTVAYEDFKQEMADLINNSGLPAVLIKSVLQCCLNEVTIIANKQYLSDKLEYEKYLNSSIQSVE